jgi:uncharacterized CHY-type Zn-finger protein
MIEDKTKLDCRKVFGVGIDAETRCVHWHKEFDVVAIKFRCCMQYYSCFDCHKELAEHTAERWPQSEFGQKAVYCGRCSSELTINEYIASGDICPHCKGDFNPGCRKHRHLYFEIQQE